MLKTSNFEMFNFVYLRRFEEERLNPNVKYVHRVAVPEQTTTRTSSFSENVKKKNYQKLSNIVLIFSMCMETE